MTNEARIVRALRDGPLYEGTLALVVGESREFRRALRKLQQAGRIERCVPEHPQSWRLTSDESNESL